MEKTLSIKPYIPAGMPYKIFLSKVSELRALTSTALIGKTKFLLPFYFSGSNGMHGFRSILFIHQIEPSFKDFASLHKNNTFIN